MPTKPKTMQSPESLRQIIRQIELTTNTLRVVADSMEMHGVDELGVRHFDSRARGMKLIDGFADKAKQSMREHLLEHGVFQAQPTNGSAKPKTKSPKKRGA